MGHIVEIEGVNKIYGTNHVVKDLNLTVEEGEFLTLLGSPIALTQIFQNYLTADLSALSLTGTSLLIVVGVALETVRQIESQMVMRHYKGFLD